MWASCIYIHKAIYSLLLNLSRMQTYTSKKLRYAIQYIWISELWAQGKYMSITFQLDQHPYLFLFITIFSDVCTTKTKEDESITEQTSQMNKKNSFCVHVWTSLILTNMCHPWSAAKNTYHLWPRSFEIVTAQRKKNYLHIVLKLNQVWHTISCGKKKIKNLAWQLQFSFMTLSLHML